MSERTSDNLADLALDESAVNLTALEGRPGSATDRADLDNHLEEARDHLQLQMLLIEVASCNESADFDLIVRAYHFALTAHAGQIRKSGEPFLQHSVEVSRILAQLRLDSTTIAAGLLHDVLEDTSITLERISDAFGGKIAALVDGVTKIERFQYESSEARQAETYRKMLLSMVEDIRVILVKFADRLHNMRTLDALGADQQQRISHETIEVYAPLAHRLGVARIRWELEDRALKFLEPDAYVEIRQKVAMRREEREALIDEFERPLVEELGRNDITAEITGRPKNFYSIFNKMRSRGKPFEEIYDLTALRITVDTVRECYHTLGLVHTLYRPHPDRFKDYIATPKTNMYQSLHTTVIGPRGMPVEVQIRTWEMHHTAEIGIAAHWRYKGGLDDRGDLDQQMSWLRQVLDWQRDSSDPAEFMENLKIELFQDEIFVFTPKGDLHQLPKAASPLDFAFAIHTDIGLHCLTAKVNGQIVPLSAALDSGDTVHIVTSPHQIPSQSWLELVKTTKARLAIRRWLKEERFSQSVRLGQEILERELKRYRHRLGPEALTELATDLELADSEHLFAGIGSGDLSVSRIINRLMPDQPKRRVIRPLFRDRRGIRIQGMHDMMIQFGKCCTPIPGDSIIGLITRGRGLSVHRTDCPNIADLAEDPERMTAVAWDLEEEQVFTVQLRALGTDRKFFLADLTRVISDTGANIVGCSTRTTAHLAEDTFWVDVNDTRQLHGLLKKMRRVKGVTEVLRVDESMTDAAVIDPSNWVEPPV
ncbi:MAG: bifunctional (p)ppGpp synthetase/guanosine-3',5'-bis(diphosphate) 3'-pyrophosphohydrolase [Candidatus Latescibacteria bacterium]|jgi:GTP pyrophosphokinase|nr:(p)ppGpp synthetase [Gemmatimonadaceae bacterium]MDP6016376.1 bifunctional (p)ppGpp synthetase/guanosine-3',5'-bis(diphosphate) 3'-pyrophosphohydrolase [Candidatus Latescibacterota bacterium]MDP7450544.1 bifunctional (p)ppGpp synthetase/guanosine-3',5'-bis(diphosphate) 3'-pyrophosphohydrolase [Candidatus Latescibacterota bacterium]HJP34171.1 bifunctional (p)ppGpp synthetase/guanosine-3',5'-bis(diphosphate) 3'-pyrophosphohydrolase [Candidatus Latescibacterota bacterium]